MESPVCPRSKDASSGSLLGRKIGVGTAAAVWRSASGTLQFARTRSKSRCRRDESSWSRHACVLGRTWFPTEPSPWCGNLAWARKVALRRSLVLSRRSGWTSSSPDEAARSTTVANLAVSLLPSGAPDQSGQIPTISRCWRHRVLPLRSPTRCYLRHLVFVSAPCVLPA